MFASRIGLFACLLAAPAWAQDIGANTKFVCEGNSPNWSITAVGDDATFDFVGSNELIRALTTKAQGADWPMAHTYIGRAGSAIVLLEQASCGAQDYQARVFTQGGETPLLLIGCCTVEN